MKKFLFVACSAILLSACAQGVKVIEVQKETVTVPSSHYFISEQGDLYSDGGALKSPEGIVYAISGRVTQMDGVRLIEGEYKNSPFDLRIFPERCATGYKAQFDDQYGTKALCLQFTDEPVKINYFTEKKVVTKIKGKEKKIAYGHVKAKKKKTLEKAINVKNNTEKKMLENFP